MLKGKKCKTQTINLYIMTFLIGGILGYFIGVYFTKKRITGDGGFW